MEQLTSQPHHIRNFRKLFHLTQEELANYLGTTRITINRWENGKAPIPSHLIFTLRGLAQHIKTERGEK